MDVLVTGASGFLGRYVLPPLVQGHRVTVAHHPGTPRPAGYGDASVIEADLADPGSVAGMDIGRFDAVVHMAAIANPRTCEADPDLAQRINVDATRDLARAATGRFVLLSTVHVYGRAGPGIVLHEDLEPRPAGVYATSKRDAEQAVTEAAPAGGWTTLRLSNVYGPGQHPDYVIGRILAAARAGAPLQVRDDRPVRDFVYAEDIAAGILAAATGPRSADGPVNLGSGRSVPIRTVLEEVASLAGLQALPAESPSDTPDEVHVDARRALEVLGWRATTPLRDGLARCLAPGDAPC